MRVSVVIVSRNRPDALRRCLRGVEQLYFPEFEIIVVADPAGCAVAQGIAGKVIEYDAANISAARNLGLGQAAGEVVAFIDDDAVPEPTWLTHLAAPFAVKEIASAGGFVRGRNGISFQNRARIVSVAGEHHEIEVAETKLFAAEPYGPEWAIKTEGCNCAFRRDALIAIGGFDPAFRFFLDETDVNLRLRHLPSALVPLAQVHHGFAASAYRTAARVPRDLHEIGASQAVFLRKHAPHRTDILASFRQEQHDRLIRHMIAGTCEPRDVTRVLRSLETGISDGMLRPIVEPSRLERPTAGFALHRSGFNQEPPITLAGRPWNAREIRQQARDHIAKGQRVSSYILSPSALYHQVHFTQDGVWQQTGGLWGRSDRAQPLVQLRSFAKRQAAEIARTGVLRTP